MTNIAGDAIDVAERIIHATREGDFASVWALFDPDYRALLAQGWVIARIESGLVAETDAERVPAVVADLASDRPVGDGWPAFSADQLEGFQAAVGGRAWIAHTTRDVGPNEVLVVFIPADTEAGTDAETIELRMRPGRSGWRYVGFPSPAAA